MRHFSFVAGMFSILTACFFKVVLICCVCIMCLSLLSCLPITLLPFESKSVTVEKVNDDRQRAVIKYVLRKSMMLCSKEAQAQRDNESELDRQEKG